AFLGHVGSEKDSQLIQVSLINRVLSLFAIWTVALLAGQRKTFERDLLKANQLLDAKVAERTAELGTSVESLRKEAERRAQAQADVERQTQRLHGLMDAIPDNVYFKDREGRYLLINQAKAERSGLANPIDAVGKSDFDFFPAGHARAAFAAERRIMET